MGGSGTASLVSSFAKGADVSWLTAMEAAGRKFYNDQGVAADLFQILKDHGINAIRLRVWVNPAQGWNGLADVTAKALRAKKFGMDLMVDFHYSDNWADPGKQYKPAAWANHSIEQLYSDVYHHTFEVCAALKKAGITPKWVQVGNETDHGMLWEEGRAPAHMDQYAKMVASGYQGVKEVFAACLVIVHISNGYHNALFRENIGGLLDHGAPFDVIGMSLYPSIYQPPAHWSSYNEQCLNNMNDMVVRFSKPVMLCEVGMEWTLAANCKEFLLDLIRKVKSLPGGNGLGVFYWEPQAYHWGEDDYQMGAWRPDGRPTKAMEAFLDE
jgi:arabinogalactan endo-1,4-beta-galactosidase